MKKLNKTTVKHRLPLVHADGAKLAHLITGNILKAHEATGHTTIMEHVGKMHRAVQKACCDDARFCTPPTPQAGQMQSSYIPKPYVVDITTPDEGGQHHAIIQTAKGELVRHGFDFNKDEGTATLVEGNSTPTERTSIYARECDRHQNMVKATQETISCRATGGVKLSASEPWESGKSVSYIYAPGGITTISAGFRKNESITCTVCVDEDTAKDLQDSFDFIAATEKQEPYADEDHEAKKATLRFPPGKVEFTYGTHRGEEGVIVKGAEPTSYGAEAVNGKTYASWSPEFATDADYDKANCKKGHWTFPDGVRGSASNPARLIAVNFVTGALTNKPAFKNMPPVKAKLADVNADEADKIFATLFNDDAEREAFAAQHPSIGWLRAAIGLDDGEVVKAGAPMGNKNAAGKHSFQDLMHKAEEKHTMLSVRAGSMGDKARKEGGIHNHARALAAFSEAYHAAKDLAEKSHNAGYSDRGRDAENDAAGHKSMMNHHAGVINENMKTQAATPPAEDDTVKAAAAAAAKAAAAPDPMAAIYARQSANHEAVEKLAARVPATATRAGLDAILARQTVTGTGEVVKAAGTSEGVKKAWEKRHSGGDAPEENGIEFANHLSGKANSASDAANKDGSYLAHSMAHGAHRTAQLAHKHWGSKDAEKYHDEKAAGHWDKMSKALDAINANKAKATSTTEPTLETLYARVGANGQTR